MKAGRAETEAGKTKGKSKADAKPGRQSCLPFVLLAVTVVAAFAGIVVAVAAAVVVVNC